MSESNGHSNGKSNGNGHATNGNGKPHPSPHALWLRADGDREEYRRLMSQYGWLEYDANENRFSRVELCTKLAWCTLPAGHDPGCVVENPRFERSPDLSITATSPHGWSGENHD